DWLEGAWSGMKTAPSHAEKPESWYGKTGVAEKTLQKIGAALTAAPKDFNLNSKIARQLEQKKSMFKSGEGFDWATAEALAFGSLAVEGFKVRLSGQDVGRGTFSQRHAILHDQENQMRYLPLQNIDDKQAAVEVVDSPLSEYGVMGFDYGYSLADPKALVCWEAQFGDFSNGAQIIIDQFISSSESKWLRMSGLTLLLPHGYEGQGPEHSSCRLERYLQLCAEDNMQVANCSTPANYFHILRRQMKRDFRKPLIIATPKSLLRHKLCVSKLSDMAEGTSFQPVLTEIDQLDAAKVKRVVLCTGKIYYDLYEARAAAKISNVALFRVEQLYPWPEHALVEILKPYKAAEFAWCQEEPQNMGAWTYLDRRLEKTLTQLRAKNTSALYLGRPEAASPAVGYLKKHEAEQKALLEAALKV
ncbi:MAG: 2-oxoglutarate dehydrogenase E1 component, partial [Dongiaceae bacterium]